MKEVKSCGVFVMRREPELSFLLLRHASRWDLPKGHVDAGESDRECALRELREETGYEGQGARLLGKVFANPAIMSNTCHTVIIENCALKHGVEWDSGEDMVTKLVPITDIADLVASGIAEEEFLRLAGAA
mgnify:CR=1 FL=1